MNLIKFLYLPLWYFKIRVLKKKLPLQTVIFITNICNYNCKHCCIDKSVPTSMTYEEVKENLIYSYNRGARFVDFEGGEPASWSDGNKNINDLCSLAKSIGFFSTSVTTNASKDFSYLNADHIFVSLDGISGEDIVRGEGAFEKLNQNIEKFPNPERVSANMVINPLNLNEVTETLKFVQNSPYISGISFNFYTPHNGNKELCIKDKKTIIEKIFEYKKNGYKIINTYRGLRYMVNPNYEHVCWITDFISITGEKSCGCLNVTPEICANCGFGMSGEMRAIYDFNICTIIEGLRLRC